MSQIQDKLEKCPRENCCLIPIFIKGQHTLDFLQISQQENVVQITGAET